MSAELVGVVFVVLVGAIGALLIREARQRRRNAVLLGLLSSFGPAVAAGNADPEILVGWAEVAKTARRLFPDTFHQLDVAANGHFPFSGQVVEASHARWTAKWLAWERQHDLEYKRRTNEAEAAVEQAGDDRRDVLRTQLAAINQEKLQTYQDRYEHYVRVGKALASLDEPLDE